MKTIALAATSLATALVLAAGTAAIAKDPPSNRGYVVGAGGVARLANDAGAQDVTTPADQAVSTETQAQRLVIKTKSNPPVAEPIGINEPGINRAASALAAGTDTGQQTDRAEGEDAKVKTPSGNTIVRNIRKPH